MILEIINQWDEKKHKLEEYFKTTKQSEYGTNYGQLLIKIFEICEFEINGNKFDLSKITMIDDGNYQGTQLFIIPEDTYQPSISNYIITNTEYGSCSGCDTLQAICDYDYDLPTEGQVKSYMTLSLHLVQKIKQLH